jgi:hypothetical protein
MDLEYLGRSLNQRSYAAAEAFGREKAAIMARGAANGSLASGRTLIQFDQGALSVFTEKANEAAQFVFNLTETTDGEVANQLEYCLGRMVDMIATDVTEGSSRLGISGGLGSSQANKTREKLNERKAQLMDDFRHGMMGSGRLKKDPLVSVINTQTNSPGATQQIGIGDNFSQSIFSQTHNELVTAIDRALNSQEFTQLQPAQKEAYSDTALVVKEEAAKAQPDAGKLKRWGTRLVDLGKDVGMKVATAEIVHLLAKMFGA